MAGWRVRIGDYTPAAGTVLIHEIGTGLPCQIGPDPVQIQRQPMRKDDTLRPLRAGAIARRPDLLSPLYVNVPVEVFGDGDSNRDVEDNLDEFLGAWQPRTYGAWLYVDDPTGVAYAYRGKPHDIALDESKIRSGVIYARALFEATHPNKYSQVVHHQTVSGGTPGAGGLAFPFGFPFGFSTLQAPSSTVCDNVGNMQTWPLVVLTPTGTQPVGPWIIGANGLFFTYNAQITPGRIVVIDMGEGLVLDEPSSFAGFDVPMEPAPTDGLLVSTNVLRPGSDWLPLPPGNSTFNVSIRGGTGTVDVYWRDAWFR